MVPQETHSDAESTVTTKTAATRSGNQKSKASTTNAKAKAKGRAGNKKQDKENEEPEAEAALGTQSMNQNTLLVEKEESGADQKKRPLQLRSPDAKDFIGEKFSKYSFASLQFHLLVSKIIILAIVVVFSFKLVLSTRKSKY